MGMSNHFSQRVNTFHGRELPETGVLAGYALLSFLVGSSGPKPSISINRVGLLNDYE